jgi:hypothetical protein
MSSTLTLQPRKTLRLYPSTHMASGMKQKSKSQKTMYTDYSGKGDTRDDTGGDDDLPEKKKRYVRGEQVDQFSVYIKPVQVRNQTVLRWLATRSSGKDKIRFEELIQDIQKRSDGSYKLIFLHTLLKNRGLSDKKLKTYLETLGKELGFELDVPSIKDYSYYLLTSEVPNIESEIMKRVKMDSTAEYNVGGVSLLWGDFIPYFNENYMIEQIEDKDMERQVEIYMDYIEKNQLKTTPYFEEIKNPPFSCLQRIGQMKFRGSCNSAGLFIDILKLKKKYQGFLPVFDYMPDVDVEKKIMSMVYEDESLMSKSSIYQPARNQFAFAFQANLRLHKLPYLLVCDFMFSFSKMVERDVEVKISLRDNPVSCASLETCLPYFSKEEIQTLNQISKLLDIETFESENIEKETQGGKRCRVQVFGSEDELDEWKQSQPEMENDWFFHSSSKSKNLRYSPRSIRKNDEIIDYQTAFDQMTSEQQQRISQARSSRIRKARGF